MKLNQTVKDIKTLKIQGAVNIAITAVKALNQVSKSSKAKKKKELLLELKKAQTKLATARITEPEMRNGLKYILRKPFPRTVKEIKKEINQRTSFVVEHFNNSKDYIGHRGSLKIKNNMIIFTHCHSSTAIKVLEYAKKKRKRFYVHNTETRPLYQGRKTAKELSKLKIPVQHYIDSAAMLALKDADIMLIGADEITAKGDVINKVGSRLLAEAAEFYNTRVYVCTDSWAYNSETKRHKPRIEQRDPAEVWKKAPKGIKIINPAFEIIPAKLIDGIISELGLHKPEHFLMKVKKHYPWLK